MQATKQLIEFIEQQKLPLSDYEKVLGPRIHKNFTILQNTLPATKKLVKMVLHFEANKAIYSSLENLLGDHFYIRKK